METDKLSKLINPHSDVHARVLKHWLEVNGLEYYANTRDDLAKSLEKLIKSGKLTRERLDRAILEIEETGGKRIFLRYLTDKSAVKTQKDLERHLRSKKLRLVDSPTRTKYNPEKPTLNYVCWEESKTKGKKAQKKRGDKIRIKYSETQLRRIVDLEAETISSKKITKVVVIAVELGTGFASIFIDYPEAVHDHKDVNQISKREIYEQFYLDKVSEIFDCSLQKFNLDKAIERLVHTEPHIIRIPNEKVRTGGNSRQIYASEVDVRFDPARQGAEEADGDNWEFEDLAGYWIPERSKGKLHRELFTQLVRFDSMIRVRADCLADEVDYVISRVR